MRAEQTGQRAESLIVSILTELVSPLNDTLKLLGKRDCKWYVKNVSKGRFLNIHNFDSGLFFPETNFKVYIEIKTQSVSGSVDYKYCAYREIQDSLQPNERLVFVFVETKGLSQRAENYINHHFTHFKSYELSKLVDWVINENNTFTKKCSV